MNKLLFTENSVYDGEVVNGKANGYGTFTWTKSNKLDKYVGFFENCNLHGYGKLFYKDGSVREGLFVNNVYLGQVYDKKTKVPIKSLDHFSSGAVIIKSRSKDGTFVTYEGDWYKGYKHGYGKIIINEKNYVLDGFFFNDKFVASKFTDIGGNNVKLINGSYSGNVKILYDDGEIYTGFWKDGYKVGYGEQIFSNGDKYSGYWKNDLPETDSSLGEIGEYHSKVFGLIYKGEFKNGNFDGKGHLYSPGRSFEGYSGSFKSGLKHGKGTFYQDGIGSCDENWVNGKRFGIQKYELQDSGIPGILELNYLDDKFIDGSYIFCDKDKNFELKFCKMSFSMEPGFTIDIKSVSGSGSNFGNFIYSLLDVFNLNILGRLSSSSEDKILNLASENGCVEAKNLIDERKKKELEAIEKEKQRKAEEDRKWRDSLRTDWSQKTPVVASYRSSSYSYSSYESLSAHDSVILSRGCDTTSYLIWD